MILDKKEIVAYSTDANKIYFLTTLPVNPEFLSKKKYEEQLEAHDKEQATGQDEAQDEAQAEAQAERYLLSDTEKKILKLCKNRELAAKTIAEKLGYKTLS